MSYKRIDESLNDIDVKNISNQEYKNKDKAKNIYRLIQRLSHRFLP